MHFMILLLLIYLNKMYLRFPVSHSLASGNNHINLPSQKPFRVLIKVKVVVGGRFFHVQWNRNIIDFMFSEDN